MDDYDYDPIETLYDQLERKHLHKPKDLAAAIQKHVALMSCLDKGMLIGRYVLCKYVHGLEEECELPVNIASIVVDIRALERCLTAETKGNSCIPETAEAEFAAKVCRHARNLCDLEAGVLLGLTGVRPEKLKDIRKDAAVAVDDAHYELYGHPADQL